MTKRIAEVDMTDPEWTGKRIVTALYTRATTTQAASPDVVERVEELEGLKHDLGRVMKRENRYLNALLNAEEKLAQNHDSIADLRAAIHTALGSEKKE